MLIKRKNCGMLAERENLVILYAEICMSPLSNYCKELVGKIKSISKFAEELSVKCYYLSKSGRMIQKSPADAIPSSALQDDFEDSICEEPREMLFIGSNVIDVLGKSYPGRRPDNQSFGSAN